MDVGGLVAEYRVRRGRFGRCSNFVCWMACFELAWELWLRWVECACMWRRASGFG